MTWSHRELMCAISDSEMSVPIEMTAAAFRVASSSSGRMAAKSVEAAFVRKPVYCGVRGMPMRRTGTLHTHSLDDLRIGNVVDNDFGHFREMPTVPLLQIHNTIHTGM